MTISECSDLDNCLRRAVEQYRAGDLDAAEEICRSILQHVPRHAATLHFLGALLGYRRKYHEAIDLIREAISLSPQVPSYHFNLGQTHLAVDQPLAARRSFEQALALDPNYCDPHVSLAQLLQQQGSVAEAIEHLQHARALRPEDAVIQMQLGRALQAANQLTAASRCFEEAAARAPNDPEAYFVLGNTQRALGQLDAAERSYCRSITLKSDSAAVFNNLGLVRRQRGQFDDAWRCFETALTLDPGFAEAYNNRGLELARQRRAEEALAAFDEALRLRPEFPEAHLNRGVVLHRQHRIREALAAFDEALRLRPEFPEAHLNRGNIMKDRACIPEALSAYRTAYTLRPSYAEAYSNYLLCLNYDPDQTDVLLRANHRAWAARFGHRRDAFTSYENSRDPARPLRIGIISADFGQHPFGFFLRPLLTAFNRKSVAYLCYANTVGEDWLTHILKANASGWRCVVGTSDRELADLVRADGIDILIDMSGHTAGNRLGCFAYKPAPVHVSWAGSHGVGIVDCSLWTRNQVPDGAERWIIEEVVHLPDARWCYGPPEYAPEVADPPVLTRGYITFGTFNNLTKLNAGVLSLWNRVLAQVPGSRLMVSWPIFADCEEKERVAGWFAEYGIDPRRLELGRGAGSHAGVLAEYGEIDIALDPFPFSGCLTTLEALWMGVPVVTLPKTRPASRQSLDFLTALGRTEWVAKDPEEYVRIAAALASNPECLQMRRRTQRRRMAQSPLCDSARFATNFEAALRCIWQNWCTSKADLAKGKRRARRDGSRLR